MASLWRSATANKHAITAQDEWNGITIFVQVDTQDGELTVCIEELTKPDAEVLRAILERVRMTIE